MSKKGDKDDKSLKPVPLPAYPKRDEKDREKWATEYDKVETELLKRHISTPNTTTTTMGLRQLQGDFDRKIPTNDDPVGDTTGRRRGGQKSKYTTGVIPPRAATTEPTNLDSISPIRSQRRPLSAGVTMHSVTMSLDMGKATGITAEQVAHVLYTLIDPPLNFRTSFTVKLSGINLKWTLGSRAGDRMPNLLTLDTLRDDLHVNPSARHEAALNSPRSAFVLLRNGTSIDDLQQETLSHFLRPGVTEEMAEVALNHHDERRRALIASLQAEYHNIRDEVQLDDVLSAIATIQEEKEEVGVDVTFIKDRMSKQVQAAERNKEKMERAFEYTQELQQRAVDAERRRLQADDEIHKKRIEQREESRRRVDASVKRMAELRETTNVKHQAFLNSVEARRKKMEEKEKAREEARENHRRILREETERKQRQKDERLRMNRAVLQKRQEDTESRFRDKEARAAERKRRLDEEKLMNRNELEEKQRRADEQREFAREKASEHEQFVIQRAEDRANQAQQRMDNFFQEREAQRKENRIRERRKNEERRNIFRQSEQRLANRQQRILDDRAEHEHRMNETKLKQEIADRHHHQLERMQQEDKRFLVERQNRALEFRKLMSISGIGQKEQRADAISKQRQRLLDATLCEREMMRLDRERMDKEMQKHL